MTDVMEILLFSAATISAVLRVVFRVVGVRYGFINKTITVGNFIIRFGYLQETTPGGEVVKE